jgi:transcriptional regulator with XRE-family HTH domain
MHNIDNETVPTLGEKIKLFRERASMTQMDLELSANLSFGTVSKLERDLRDPGKRVLFKLIEALDLDPKEAAYLFEINIY